MPTESLSSSVLDLVLAAGPVAKAVLAVLLLFSIVSWALIVEKWWQFRRVRGQSVAFLRVFREGRRSSASILRIVATVQPAQPARSAWVRSSFLRRSLSHSPNETGASMQPTSLVG